MGIAACLTWLLAAMVGRMSSLAALVAALAAPIWTSIFGLSDVLAMILIMVALVLLRHRENIRRIAAGTEPRIGKP